MIAAMRTGAGTRQAIIDEALRQAIARGFDGLTLGTLAADLNMSKSGLFAHFKSKEALQMAVLEEGLKRFSRRVIEPIKQHPRGLPRLEKAFTNFLQWIQGDSKVPGCLFITASQEFHAKPGPIRDQLVQLQRAWRSTLEYLVQQAFADSDSLSPEQAKLFVFEMIGIALVFQQTIKLLDDDNATGQAHKAFQQLITRYRQILKSPPK